MNAEIWDAHLGDIREIREVARRIWEHTYREIIPASVRAEFVSRAYSEGSLERRIRANVVLVAVRDGDVVGFADFRRVSEAEAELAAIYVLPEAQGQGIGSRLLEAGVDRLAPVGKLTLRVERDNANARRFYQARGFGETGEFVEDLFGHRTHEIGMVLESRR